MFLSFYYVAYHYYDDNDRSVIIEKCQRSTIILGAVETSIDLNRCEQVTVIGVARRFSAQ